MIGRKKMTGRKKKGIETESGVLATQLSSNASTVGSKVTM
jgi:hypothetical protein